MTHTRGLGWEATQFEDEDEHAPTRERMVASTSARLLLSLLVFGGVVDGVRSTPSLPIFDEEEKDSSSSPTAPPLSDDVVVVVEKNNNNDDDDDDRSRPDDRRRGSRGAGGGGIWGGWGHGYDTDDGPRRANANTANRTHPVLPDPEAARFEPRSMRPHTDEHIVSLDEYRSKREKLRAVKPVPPDGGYWGAYPNFHMPDIDDEATPVTPEEWIRRPIAPPHNMPFKGGWKRPPRGTLSWSHKARAAAMSEIRRLQFPPNCDTANILAVPLEMCPLGCRTHIFLQRALVLSVQLGRTLVPLPPWDVGFSHLFQPFTNCSLTPTRRRAPRPGEEEQQQANPGKGRRRDNLARALEMLSDMFLASGAPHEKLHPLELTYHQVMEKWPKDEEEGKKEHEIDPGELEQKKRFLKGRKLGSIDTVVQVWFDRMEELLREQSVGEWLDGEGGWEEKKHKLKGAVKVLAEAIHSGNDQSKTMNGDGSGGGGGGGDVLICTNGRCDNIVQGPTACVRPDGCFYDAEQQQMPSVLWRLMRGKSGGLRFTGHPGGPYHRGVRNNIHIKNNQTTESIEPEPLTFQVNDKMKQHFKEKTRLPPKRWERFEQLLNHLSETNAGEMLPLPGYPVPHAFGVPLKPPRVPGVHDANQFGCNDWPSACQPHFMFHSMLTTWILTRPLASVADLITPEIFHNLGAVRHPVVTLQVRRSDKKGEDPFWNLYGGYRDLKTYIRAMEVAAVATGKCFRTIILMTDAKHALLALRRMHHRGRVRPSRSSQSSSPPLPILPTSL